MVLRCERTRSVQKRVVERVLAGKCIGEKRNGAQCESINDGQFRNGLCRSCDNCVTYVQRNMSETERLEHNQRLVANGFKLRPGEIHEIKNQSAFQRLA